MFASGAWRLLQLGMENASQYMKGLSTDLVEVTFTTNARNKILDAWSINLLLVI